MGAGGISSVYSDHYQRSIYMKGALFQPFTAIWCFVFFVRLPKELDPGLPSWFLKYITGKEWFFLVFLLATSQILQVVTPIFDLKLMKL